MNHLSRCSFLYNNQERCDAMAVSSLCHYCLAHAPFLEYNYPVSRQRDNFNFLYNHNLDRLYEIFSDESTFDTESEGVPNQLSSSSTQSADGQRSEEMIDTQRELPFTNTENTENTENRQNGLNHSQERNILNEESRDHSSGLVMRNSEQITFHSSTRGSFERTGVNSSLPQTGVQSPRNFHFNRDIDIDIEERMYKSSKLCNKFGHSYCAICFCEKFGVYMKCCADKQFLCSDCYLETLKTRLNDKAIMTPNIFETYKRVVVELFSVQCPYCRSSVRVDELPAESN